MARSDLTVISLGRDCGFFLEATYKVTTATIDKIPISNNAITLSNEKMDYSMYLPKTRSGNL